MDIEISGLEQVKAMLGALPNQVKKSLRDTLNQSAEVSLADGINAIAAQANIPKSKIRQKLKVRRSAKTSNLEVIVGAQSRGTGLRNFGALQAHKPGKTKHVVPGGVSVRVKPNGARKLLPKAFFVQLNNGNQHLAIRSNRYRHGFEVLYGPSVSQIFKTVRYEVQENPTELLERFLDNLAKQ